MTCKDCEAQCPAHKAPRHRYLLWMGLLVAIGMSAAALAVAVHDHQPRPKSSPYQPLSVRVNIEDGEQTEDSDDGFLFRREVTDDDDLEVMKDKEESTHGNRHARNVWGVGKRNCSAETWQQLCTNHHNTPHHGHQMVGARVQIRTRGGGVGKYGRDGDDRVQWMPTQDCIAQCAGVTSDGRYLEVAKSGIYNVRARVVSDDHFANQLYLALYVSRHGRYDQPIPFAVRVFPNTPVVVNGTAAEHRMLESTDPDMSRRKNNRVASKAKNLEDFQDNSLMVPIHLERLVHLRAHDRVHIDAFKECRPQDINKICPLQLHPRLHANAGILEIYRV